MTMIVKCQESKLSIILCWPLSVESSASFLSSFFLYLFKWHAHIHIHRCRSCSCSVSLSLSLSLYRFSSLHARAGAECTGKNSRIIWYIYIYIIALYIYIYAYIICIYIYIHILHSLSCLIQNIDQKTNTKQVQEHSYLRRTKGGQFGGEQVFESGAKEHSVHAFVGRMFAHFAPKLCFVQWRGHPIPGSLIYHMEIIEPMLGLVEMIPNGSYFVLMICYMYIYIYIIYIYM